MRLDYNELRQRAILASIDGDVRNSKRQAAKVLDAMPAKWRNINAIAPVQRGAVHPAGTPGNEALLKISDAQVFRVRTVTVPKPKQRAAKLVPKSATDLDALTAKVAALHAAIMRATT